MANWVIPSMANAEHLEILNRGVDAWKAWRAREPSIVPDLAGADGKRFKVPT